jgi:hypothetical protein
LEIQLKLFYWVLFVILLLTPLVVDFVFISSIYSIAQKIFMYYRVTTPSVLLKDILFVEGVMLLVFGTQSAEYIWKWVRGNRDYPTELRVGLALLAFGGIYFLAAILVPMGMR